MSRTFPFEAQPLAFAPTALEPGLCAEVTREHYINHYMRYIDGLNQTLSSYPAYQSWSLAKLCAFSQALPQSIRQNIANNAGGCFNHELYWHNMRSSVCDTAAPTGAFGQMIDQCFGDYQTMQNDFTQAALNLTGSGWAWLICDNRSGQLAIQLSANQATPINGRTTPILALDLWEHAYYDQYQSNKADYIDAWWQLIDWESVSDLWQEATNPTAEESAYTLAQKLKPQTSPTPYGCKSSVEATPAGESYYMHKHLNTFSNPCGGKSHSSNNYYSAKSRARRRKKR